MAQRYFIGKRRFKEKGKWCDWKYEGIPDLNERQGSELHSRLEFLAKEMSSFEEMEGMAFCARCGTWSHPNPALLPYVNGPTVYNSKKGIIQIGEVTDSELASFVSHFNAYRKKPVEQAS